MVQEVRNLCSARNEDVYDVAKGRAKQDELVRVVVLSSRSILSSMTCTTTASAMAASALADNVITAALGTVATDPTRRESEQVRICPIHQ
jgi:hypothetical protein